MTVLGWLGRRTCQPARRFGRGYSRAAPAPQSRYKDVFMSGGASPDVGPSKPGVAPNHRSRARVDPRGGVDGSGAPSCQINFSSSPMMAWRSRRCASLPRPRTNARAARSTSTPPRRSLERDARARTSCWVGEQPGDKEDLAGKPFVGPAGHVLDQALEAAGIPRAEVFVTNAVKHFKHEMRGKRRLHKRPNAYEIERCKVWLDIERRIVKPAAIVALGATAARSLFGRPITIAKLRAGAWLSFPTEPPPS